MTKKCNVESDAAGSSRDDVSAGLPRLLYVGDVPVEASYHGSALLYRLLSSIPADDLRVVEFVKESQLKRRLPGVEYTNIGRRWLRALNTRFHRWVSSLLMLSAKYRVRQLHKRVGHFQPEAIVTIVHGYSWLLAASYARRYQLPLHLIIHDNWLQAADLPSSIMRSADRQLREVYVQAASRFCISPGLARQFQHAYGAEGTVIYPARGKDCPAFAEPPAQITQPTSNLVAAYAGASLGSKGNQAPLVDVANALRPLGGKLLIYGPYSPKDIKLMGLDLPNVELRGLLPSPELIQRLREEAQLLIAQMSFLPEDKNRVEASFPSRLADYTACGIPILVYAPPYASAVQWAAQQNGAVLIADSRDSTLLSNLLAALKKSPEQRRQLGANALEVGKVFFAERTAWNTFRDGLAGAHRKHG